MERVILYNYFNIGDIHFSARWVQVLVESNPDIEFVYFVRKNTSILQHIPGLIVQSIDGEDPLVCPPPPDSTDHLNYPKTRRMSDGSIAICTWILPWFWYSKQAKWSIEVNPVGMFRIIPLILKHVRDAYGLELEFQAPFDNMDILPVCPPCDISRFLDWKKDHQDTFLVFYPNYMPMSGQPFPINTLADHDTIVRSLSDAFPDVTFVVAKSTPSMKGLPNVVFCDDHFNIIEIPITCHNVYEILAVSESCDLAISFDTGACFTYIHSGMRDATCHRLQLGIHYYRHIMQYTIAALAPDFKFHGIVCENQTDVISHASTMISKLKQQKADQEQRTRQGQ